MAMILREVTALGSGSCRIRGVSMGIISTLIRNPDEGSSNQWVSGIDDVSGEDLHDLLSCRGGYKRQVEGYRLQYLEKTYEVGK